MAWFPVAVYRWVQESIRRVPAAILNRLGMLDAPIDDDQEILVQIREDEEQQSPRQRHNSQGTLVSTSEDEEQQSPRQRQDSQEVLVHTTEDEEQHSLLQQQLPNGVFYLPTRESICTSDSGYEANKMFLSSSEPRSLLPSIAVGSS